MSQWARLDCTGCNQIQYGWCQRKGNQNKDNGYHPKAKELLHATEQASRAGNGKNQPSTEDGGMSVSVLVSGTGDDADKQDC